MPAEVVYSAYEFLHLKDVHKLPQEDVQYLNIKGCFCLPTRPVLAEFVSQYFTCLHPSLPVLNEKQFWQIFHAEEDSEDSEDECLETTIPLFVMHAMLYATCGVSSVVMKPCTLNMLTHQVHAHDRHQKGRLR